MKNPFKAPHGGCYVDVDSRLQRVKEMGINNLKAVLAMHRHVQARVLLAAESRLKRLLKEQKKNKKAGAAARPTKGE